MLQHLGFARASQRRAEDLFCCRRIIRLKVVSSGLWLGMKIHSLGNHWSSMDSLSSGSACTHRVHVKVIDFGTAFRPPQKCFGSSLIQHAFKKGLLSRVSVFG